MDAIPTKNVNWAYEIEASKISRFLHVLESLEISACLIRGLKKSDPPIIFTWFPLYSELPTEYLKHITRIFFVPHSLSSNFDLLLHDEEVKDLIKDPNSIIKILSYPISLSTSLAAFLCGDYDENYSVNYRNYFPIERIRPSNHSHILYIVYSPIDGMFRWGITSQAEAKENNITSIAMWDSVIKSRQGD